MNGNSVFALPIRKGRLMNTKKFKWEVLDPKVAELVDAPGRLSIREIAERIGCGVQTVQRSMRRQKINIIHKAVPRG
jgi:phage antirepressor YoqD-like protein